MMGVAWQWTVCGVILLGALALLAWRLGWFPRGIKPVPVCSAGCPNCHVVEAVAKRLERM